MIAFGIDPGSHRTGWGAISVDGNVMRFIDAGVIKTPTGAPLSERIEPIFRDLTTVLQEHQPDLVFIESIFHHRNARSALVLGHARGVAMLAVRLVGFDLAEISPAEVKKAVTGSGRADKSQVQEMVKILLGLKRRLPEDASDAVAVAITGATRARSALSSVGVRTA